MVCRGSGIRGSPDAAKAIFILVTLKICLKQMFRESEKISVKIFSNMTAIVMVLYYTEPAAAA